ncbi:MAG: hypothetical protein V7609_3174 [Verrucomicrobiota bacterium]
MEAGAVTISDLCAAGNATLEKKPASSSVAGGGRWPRRIALVAALLFIAGGHAPAAINLSKAETRRIGNRIWQNECGGTLAGLTSWNAGENFASLGIGHFIWYPKGVRGPFDESFPKFVDFAAARGLPLPDVLRAKDGCPWNSRAEFNQAGQSPPMKQLRDFLGHTVDLQAEFLVNRLQQALPKMLAETGSSNAAQVQERFARVAGSAMGCYALVDYVNFKGEGVLATERYAGQGWGLLQVLQGMSQETTAREAVKSFAQSARTVLKNRVRNSPPERNEARWLPGWLKRIDTYVGS